MSTVLFATIAFVYGNAIIRLSAEGSRICVALFGVRSQAYGLSTATGLNRAHNPAIRVVMLVGGLPERDAPAVVGTARTPVPLAPKIRVFLDHLVGEARHHLGVPFALPPCSNSGSRRNASSVAVDQRASPPSYEGDVQLTAGDALGGQADEVLWPCAADRRSAQSGRRDNRAARR